ncbi:hypothetical protein BDY19DRAFT_866748, partial [Irpex rosettiformis]
QTDLQKVSVVLTLMKKHFSHLSLKLFLETLFMSSNSLLKTYTGKFLKADRREELMERLWNCGIHMKGKKYNENMVKWVIKKVAKLCSYECDYLTDSASKRPHYDDAQCLRVNAKEVT